MHIPEAIEQAIHSQSPTQHYKKWVEIALGNSFCEGKIQVRNATASWGKFYERGNKDTEIPPTQISKIIIHPGEKAYICACDRSDSTSSTTGSFEFYEDNIYIWQISWDCPHIGSNSFKRQDVNSKAG
ncbi:aegerolysin type hemolysin [Nemania serpens]|nr:aegerolysin type hemolysin [Nemania serpens]